MQVACGAYYSSTVGALRSGCLPIYRGLLAPRPPTQTCNASDTGLLSTLIYQSWLLEASLPEASEQRRSHVAIVYEGDKLRKGRLEITFQVSISHSSAVSNPPSHISTMLGSKYTAERQHKTEANTAVGSINCGSIDRLTNCSDIGWVIRSWR